MKWVDIIFSNPRYWIPAGLTLSLVIYAILRVILGRAVRSAIQDTDLRFRVLKAVHFILNTLLVLAAFELVVGENWSAASFIGLLSAGVAFVFREPLLNLAGWLFIIVRQPFSLGDRVQVGESTAGDVVDIGVHDFTLLEIGNWVDADQSTGRIVHIPNAVVFTQHIANYQQGFPFVWHELPIAITFQSDWKLAKEKLTEIAAQEVDAHELQSVIDKISQQESYLFHFKDLNPVVYLDKSDYALVLTVRYACEPRQRRATETRMWKSVLTEFEQHQGIELAYPTQTIHRLAVADS